GSPQLRLIERRPSARFRVRQQRARHACRGDRRGAHPVQRRGLRRRRTRRAAARAEDRERRARRHLDDRQYPARDGVRRPLRGAAPPAPRAEPELGIGNEPGERAVIDSIVNAFLVAHPEVVFTISAGNDGPGLSTVGLPGSADLAVSVGAALPGIYVPLEQDGAPPVAGDFVGSFSGRGGRFGKPDLLAPGWAFSTVPSFDTGN